MVGPAAEAYIIMRADGTLIPRDVKSFAKKAGEGFGEEFSEAVDEEIEKAGKAGIKRFHQRLGKSIAEVDFKPLRKQGEGLDDMFERLTGRVEELFDSGHLGRGGAEKFIDSFEQWSAATKKVEQATERARIENDALARSTRDSADDSLLAARASLESAKARGKDQQAVESLGERLDALADKQREWMDRAVEAARTSDNWDPYIKKMGGMDKAMDALRRRTDEVRSSTGVYNNALAEAELSLGKYIEDVKVQIALDEEAADLKEKQTQAAKDKTKADRDAAEQTRKVNKAEEERLKGLGLMQRELDKVTDSNKKMLDSLIVKASVSGSWEKVTDHMIDMGDALDGTESRAKKLSVTVDTARERINYLREEGTLTSTSFDRLTSSLDDFHFSMSSSHGKRTEFIDDLDKMSDRIGRGFGKGARNDFVNLFGAMVGGISKFALTTPVRLFDNLSEAVGTTTSTFAKMTTPVTEGGEGFSKMASILPSLAKGIGTVATKGASGIVAIVGFSQAIGAMASAISLTGGLLTIFGRAVYLSVAAPLLAAVPALVSFGAGALVAGGAISKWADDSKPLKKALAGISNELEKVATKITPAMDGLAEFFGEKGQSVVRIFGDSVQNVLQDLYDKLDDPAMQKFYDAWSAYMPDIFESLGKSIGSFTTGLTAFFVPILPYAEKLANAIERAADRFSEWAQSSEGQNSIRDWMKNAWKTATDLWSGLQDIWGALGNIFGLADEEGGGFAAWIKDIGDRFEKWTGSEEGRESIKQWLKDAKKFGKDLKDVLAALGKAFDTLDSPAGREALSFFMDIFNGLAIGASAVAAGIDLVNRGVSALGGWLNENLYGFDASSGAAWGEEWKEEVEMWKGYVDNIEGWWDSAWKWVEDIDFTAMWEGFTTALSDWWSSIGTWFSERGTEIGDTVTGWFDIDWSGVWTSITEGVSSGWTSFTTWLSETGSDIADTVRGWFDIDWDNIWTDITAAIDNVLTTVGSTLGTVAGTVARWIINMPAMMQSGLQSAWDAITQWAADTWAAFETWAANTWTTITTWVSQLPGRIQSGLTSAYNAVVAWAESTWTEITTWATNTWTTITTWAAELPGRIQSGLASAATAIQTWAGETWTTFTTWVANIWTTFATWAAELPGQIGGAIQAGWDAVVAWGQGIGATIAEWWNGIDWAGIWENVRTGIANGITGIISWIGERASALVESFLTSLREALGIASPSQKMIEIMGYVGDGILNGLTAIPGKILSAVTSIATGIIDGIKTGLSTIGTVVGDKFTAAKDAVTSKATEIGSMVTSKFGEMPGKAKDALSSFGSKVGDRFEEGRSKAVAKATDLVSGAKTNLSKMGADASAALSNLPGKVTDRFESARSKAKSKASDLVSNAKTNLSKMGSSASSALSNLSSQIGNRFETAKNNAKSKANSLVSGAKSNLSRMGSSASSALSNLSSQIGSRFNTAKTNALNIAGQISSQVRSKMAGIPGLISGALSGVSNAISSPFQSAYNTVSRLLGQIRSAASSATSLASKIPGAGAVSGWFAEGGVISGPRVIGVGEAGPEAVVPLNRPLASVDPSVRWLSAIAQGMAVPGGGGGINIAAGAIQVVTPYADAGLVANRVLDDIVANF